MRPSARWPTSRRRRPPSSAALLAYVIVAVTVAALSGVLIALLLAPGAGVDTREWLSDAGLASTLGGAVGLALACCGWATFGLFLAIVFRSAPATIGVGVAYALPVEILVGEISGEAAQWLPGQVLQALARGDSTGVDYRLALTGTAGWIALTVTATLVIFRVREIAD